MWQLSKFKLHGDVRVHSFRCSPRSLLSYQCVDHQEIHASGLHYSTMSDNEEAKAMKNAVRKSFDVETKIAHAPNFIMLRLPPSVFESWTSTVRDLIDDRDVHGRKKPNWKPHPEGYVELGRLRTRSIVKRVANPNGPGTVAKRVTERQIVLPTSLRVSRTQGPKPGTTIPRVCDVSLSWDASQPTPNVSGQEFEDHPNVFLLRYEEAGKDAGKYKIHGEVFQRMAASLRATDVPAAPRGSESEVVPTTREHVSTGVAMLSGSSEAEFPLLTVRAREKMAEQAKLVEKEALGTAKRIRGDRDTVKRRIMGCFRAHDSWKLQDLAENLEQPQDFVKQLLMEVAEYRPSDHMWELKQDYKVKRS
jgi:hypothetical protein